MAPHIKRDAVNKLHHEIRRAISRCTRIENVCDVRMFKPRQRDLLGFKATQRIRIERGRAQDLDGDDPLHRLELLSLPHHAKCAFTNKTVESHAWNPWRYHACIRVSCSEEIIGGEMLLAAGFHRFCLRCTQGSSQRCSWFNCNRRIAISKGKRLQTSKKSLPRRPPCCPS